jgi:enoyl-CoA hydratase
MQLSLKVADQIATITFDNPPLQVMTPATINELNALTPRLMEDDVRVIIFTGASDKYFIRHFSVEELDANTRGEGGGWDISLDALLCQLERMPKPFICAMNGSAMGGGLEFALAADIRVVKDGPFTFGLPEVSVGLLPGGGGTQRLTAVVGRGRAMELMLRPRLIGAKDLLAYGVVEVLVDADSEETALERARHIALEIASRPPLAVAHIKRLVREAVSPVTMEMLTLESKLFSELMRTPETQALLKAVAAQHRVERATREAHAS